VDPVWKALFIHRNGRHEIEVQEGQVHEIVLRKGFALKMTVHTSKPLQASFSIAVLFQIGDDNLLVVANDDKGCPAPAVNQDTDLAADFKRELTNGFGKIRRYDVSR